MQEALKIVLEKLVDVKFALVGSFNLQTQGIDVSAHDLDILTNDEGLIEIAEIFKSEIDDSESYKQTGFMIGETEVQAVNNDGNSVRLPDFQKYIVIVEKDGLKIPCMSLESELYFYTNSGREKDKLKVGLIKEKINK